MTKKRRLMRCAGGETSVTCPKRVASSRVARSTRPPALERFLDVTHTPDIVRPRTRCSDSGRAQGLPGWLDNATVGLGRWADDCHEDC